MKKLIVIALTAIVLAIAPVAKAETVSCTTQQYGGSVCGITTTTSTEVVEHNYGTGLSSREFYTIIASLFGVAVIATVLYKLTYKNYLLG